MSATLKVRIRRAEGCILRLLGQIGRRGYEILGVTARLEPDRKVFEVSVELEPFIPMAPGKPRPFEVLPALVTKLADVVSAEFTSMPRAAGEAPREPRASKPPGEMAWEE
jgi:acetolactate synthase regulatory subunit